jgi:hypothetical protein
MKDLNTLPYHSLSEELVDILCRKTQNKNQQFFRVLVSYQFAKVASSMRASILTKDRGSVPINMYAINLSPSGEGKTFSTNILENQLTQQFKTVFEQETVPIIEEENIAKLAVKRAAIKNIDPDEYLTVVEAEYRALGPMPFTFDSGTTAAVKQLRHTLLMSGIGAMSLQIDEIGSNLLGNADVLGTFLETYDAGLLKQKICKHTRDNIRNEDIDGSVPTNMLLFGTPSKLLNGSKVEDEFYSFLETGYARRCLFGFSKFSAKETGLTPEQVYNNLCDTTSNTRLVQISNNFAKLAGISHYNKQITMPRDVSILLIEYRMYCEKLAEEMGEHEEIRKAEMNHRYFKVLKLAGAYAFVDGKVSIDEDTLYAAVKMVEESGRSLNELLNRERNYVKLAKYIANLQRELTHVDLTEDLPFYKGSSTAKADLMNLAIAWGYKHHIIIKKTNSNNIEFITGETLKETDLSKMVVSWSADQATGYKNVICPFSAMHALTQKPFKNWINHHTNTGRRQEDCIAKGFNCIVLDVDDGTPMSVAKLLLEKYMYLMHTTKRHTAAHNRYRIILPINYNLEMEVEEYKEFMTNIFEWLPFAIDTSTGQRSRKWLTHIGYYEYGAGKELLDALMFIPQTAKNDERKQIIQNSQSLSNMERWFVSNTDAGNRNNQMIRYALMLVDMGKPYDDVRDSILELNSKLPEKLPVKEINDTILVSVGRAIAKRTI